MVVQRFEGLAWHNGELSITFKGRDRAYVATAGRIPFVAELHEKVSAYESSTRRLS